MRKAFFATLILLSTLSAFGHGESRETFIVQSIVPDGAAAASGMKEGDRILNIGDLALETRADLDRALDSQGPGDTVPIVVEREGAVLELELTLGARQDGGPSLGITITVPGADTGDGVSSPEGQLTREQCVTWIGDRYRVATRIRELGLEIEEDAEALRACFERDVQRMPAAMPEAWCDNSFKIHCSGLGVLTEIGETQVQGCEKLLGEKLSSCAAQKVFDRYTVEGLLSDREDCTAAREACAAPGP